LELGTPWGIHVTTVNPSWHGTPLVSSMSDGCWKLWEKTLSDTVRMEYGQGELLMYVVVVWPRRHGLIGRFAPT
jgi:hypothetical protein